MQTRYGGLFFDTLGKGFLPPEGFYVFSDQPEDVLSKFVEQWGGGKFGDYDAEDVVDKLTTNYGLVAVLPAYDDKVPARVISSTLKPNLSSVQVAAVEDLFDIGYDQQVQWMSRLGATPIMKPASVVIYGEHEYRSLRRSTRDTKRGAKHEPDFDDEHEFSKTIAPGAGLATAVSRPRYTSVTAAPMEPSVAKRKEIPIPLRTVKGWAGTKPVPGAVIRGVPR